jgi:uncharacterized membrane protein
VAIKETIEISRGPEDVFAYLDDLATHGEWQEQIVSAKVDGDGPTRVGTRSTEVRKMGGREQQTTYEITEHDPPHKSSWRTVDGPVRAVGSVIVDPVGDGARSRVTIEFNLEGHGLGVLFAPFARMQARKQVPKDQAKLKEILERRAA